MKTLIILPNLNKRSFDVLKHRKDPFDDKKDPLFDSKNDNALKEQLIQLSGSDQFTIKTISDKEGNKWRLVMFSTRDVSKGLFAEAPTQPLQRRPSRRNQPGEYHFIDYKDHKDTLLKALPVLEEIAAHLLKPKTVKPYFGANGRSKIWNESYHNKEKENAPLSHISRGFGFIPNPESYPNIVSWNEVVGWIQKSEPNNPLFTHNNGLTCSPKGSTYRKAIDMGEIHIIIAENAAKRDTCLASVAQQVETDKNFKQKHSFFKFTGQKQPVPLLPSNEHSVPGVAELPDKSALCQPCTLDQKKLDKVVQQKKKNKGQRSCSQNQVWGNDSATSRAYSLGLPQTCNDAGTIIPLRYEWTHLLAHQFIGSDGQIRENLVLATEYCNTLMMHLECLLKTYVGNKYPVHIQVNAPLVENPEMRASHCVQYIDYHLNINNCLYHFRFDPFLQTAPPRDLYKGLRGYIESKWQRPTENKTPGSDLHAQLPSFDAVSPTIQQNDDDFPKPDFSIFNENDRRTMSVI